MIALTRAQARTFLLLHHGLLGAHRFIGAQGAVDFVRQAGCIQFDPVNVCGRNADLTLQSRVKGYKMETLHALLYEQRALVDYADKQLSIFPVEDWPYFARYREAARRCGAQFEGLSQLEERAKAYIRENGPVDSASLPIGGEIEWHSAIHWSGNWHGKSNAARSVLEQLYSAGELVIHHKRGTRKVYDLAERHIAPELLAAAEPLESDAEHIAWRVLRRIGAVGLLWNRPSDAFLGIWDLDAAARNAAFERLLADNQIFPVQVEGIRGALYCREADRETLLRATSGERLKPRCEVIAPLDPLMWDRKLVRAVFGFEYSWEIYTPESKRKYGYYVLPMVVGAGFAGRVEAAAKGDTLVVSHVWLEKGVRRSRSLEKAIEGCMKRLARLNGCARVEYAQDAIAQA